MITKLTENWLQVTCSQPRGQMQPKSKGHSRFLLRGSCQTLGASTYVSLSANLKANLEGSSDQEDQPRSQGFRGTEGSTESRPRKSHLGTCVTLTCSHCPGPGELRSPASSESVPGTAKPSHAAQPRVQVAFPAATAGGSGGSSCKYGRTDRGLLPRARSH